MAADRPRRFAAWTVQSDFALPELPPATEPADWHVTRDGDAALRRGVDWYQRASAVDGLPWVWFGRRGSVEVVRFPGLGWCAIDEPEGRLGCAWRKHLPAEDCEHLLINHALPLAATLAGALVLHASVVVRPDGVAVAFAGPVGAGKSTMALALASRGWKLLSDDRLVLDRDCMAYPVAPCIRVAPGAAAHLGFSAALPDGHRKVRLRGNQRGLEFCGEPVRLERIVVIEHRDGPTSAAPIAGRDASIAVLVSLLQLGLNRPDVRRRVFERVGELISSVATTRLRIAKRWDRLSEIEDALRAA